MKNVTIIGGGASGILCAIFLAKKGNNVTIIEKQDRIGKKILSTGNGRCNLTNNHGFIGAYNVDISNFLLRFGYSNTIKFFNELGLLTYFDEEGRAYPISNCARSVLDIFKIELKRLNVKIETNEEVEHILPQNHGYLIKTKQKTFFSTHVVISVGGLAGEKFFNELNVKFEKYIPSLCALSTPKNNALAGVKQSNVLVKFKEFSEIGEVLFKESGISGIVIFNLSNYLSKTKTERCEISLDLLPNVAFNKLLEMLKSRIKSNQNLLEFLTGIFHNELNFSILKKCDLNFEMPSKNLAENQIEKLAKTIKNYTISVLGKCDNNQIYAGGVELFDLDQNLMLKNFNGLYVTGEAINVFGMCGGYNLQWAFTSAFIVGDAI